MDARRKKLLYQSQHCGMKENDILLGRFAENQVASMDENELTLFEAVMTESDLDLYNWITGRELLPERMNQSVMLAIVDFNSTKL
jgi:antitoxin CptB